MKFKVGKFKVRITAKKDGGIVIEIELGNIGGHTFIGCAHLLKPYAIVPAQGFAHRESHQARAIALVSIPLIAQLIELGFGYRGEPTAEVIAILISAQLNDIRYPIIIRIN